MQILETGEDWRRLAEDVRQTTPKNLWIDGEERPACNAGGFKSVDPFRECDVATIALASELDIDAAVSAADAAFRSGVWSALPPRDRAAVLFRFADLIEQDAKAIAAIECLEVGKPVSAILAEDIPVALMTLRFMAEAADKLEGHTGASRHDVLALTLREPLGVVGAISPWNYPLMLAIWKIAPALAAGNTVVLKPAEQASLSALRLGAMFKAAGGPDGVLNIITGPGEITGRALALHPGVAKITFTGSTEVGRKLFAYAGQSSIKRIALECGGKSPQIFFPDMPDIHKGVEGAVRGAFANQGEVCNAGTRILVHRDIYTDFLDLFTQMTPELYQCGDPMDPATTMGTLISRDDQQRVLRMVSAGVDEGARLVFGGTAREGGGCFVEPTLFADASNQMSIAQQEIFGPVATVIPFESEKEAVSIANDSVYGLAAAVWTQDGARGLRMAKAIQAGTIWINCFDDGDMTIPFGGYKQSGHARDRSFESLREFTQTKAVWMDLASAAVEGQGA
nr:aldehyde dehydrogenase family protein [uncultured Hyphomonas sp.]